MDLCGRVKLESEEITASIDLEGSKLTKKLKMANITASVTSR